MIAAEKGEAVQQITQTGSVNCPAFFPGGNKILYGRWDSEYKDNVIHDTFSIWSSDFEDSSPLQHGFGKTPSFFPNSKKVCVANNGELRTLELDTGTEVVLFNSMNTYCYLPSVSPDGTQIAFHGLSKDVSPKNNREIYLINADGTNLRRITFHPGNDYQPKWSKDGKSLFFVSQRGNSEGTYNLWKIELE